MTSEKNRFDFVDISRGMAMFVVISWHIIGVHSVWTDGWTMPLFFVIMGLFYRQTATFREIWVKKVNTILVPHIICSIPAFIISLVNTGLAATAQKLLNPYGCINPVSWFLLSMFFCYSIYWMINRIAHGNVKMRIAMVIIVSLFGFYSSEYIHILEHRLVFPFFISTSLTSVGFVEIGRIVSNPILRGGVKLSGTILITALFILVSKYLKPAPSDMVWNNYNVCWINLIINSLIGCLLVIQVCKLLQTFLNPVKHIGRLSLLMLTLHMYIHNCVSLVISNLYADYVITSIVTVITAFLVEKFFPIAAGKVSLIK